MLIGENQSSLFHNNMVLICKNLSPLHLRMLYVKFGWTWPNGSGEEDFKISSINFCFS